MIIHLGTFAFTGISRNMSVAIVITIIVYITYSIELSATNVDQLLITIFTTLSFSLMIILL